MQSVKGIKDKFWCNFINYVPSAMTTSKWDLLEQESDTEKEVAAKDIDEDIDGAWVFVSLRFF